MVCPRWSASSGRGSGSSIGYRTAARSRAVGQYVRVTPEDFAAAIDANVQAGTEGLVRYLRSPSGRNPPQEWVRWSGWFNALQESDQTMVVDLLHEAAFQASFNICSALDDVASIENRSSKGWLVLDYVTPTGEHHRLNDHDVALLHDELKEARARRAT